MRSNQALLRPDESGHYKRPVLDIDRSTDDVSSPFTLLASETHSPASELAGVFAINIANQRWTLSSPCGFFGFWLHHDRWIANSAEEKVSLTKAANRGRN